VRDCELLARFLPHLTGGALPINEVNGDGNAGGTSSHSLRGRSDWVDEEHKKLQRALGTLAWLNALERGGYSAEVHVLWFAYVLHGPEVRAGYVVRANRRTERRGGLNALLVKQFASAEQKAYWAAHKSRLAVERAQEDFAVDLLARAHAAYEGRVQHVHVLTALLESTRSTVPLTKEIDALVGGFLQRAGGESPMKVLESPESPMDSVERSESPVETVIRRG
jgi:hypothetical protein